MEQKPKKPNELSVEELKDALINAQRHILLVPQIKQEIAVIEQELQKRQEVAPPKPAQ